MQVLYALDAMDENPVPGSKKVDPVSLLQKQLDKTRELFVFLVHHILEVARYAETDAHVRATKNLPTEEDKNVNTKIAANLILWKINESGSFQSSIETFKTSVKTDKAVIKNIYNRLIETDIYKEYIATERAIKAEKDILQFIFTDLMLPDEDFISYLEESFSNWADDAEMMNQLVLSYLQKPQAYDVSDMLGKEKWQFARDLLSTTIERKAYLLGFISPKLKNWDVERIATLDMIMMQLGVCELLYFETIPPKVTINEYIDIAKEYSTPQSGQFINGILDNIHKELLAANKIHKVDFKAK